MDMNYAFDPTQCYELDVSFVYELSSRHRLIGDNHKWSWLLSLNDSRPRIIESSFVLSPRPKLILHHVTDLPSSYLDLVRPFDSIVASTIADNRYATGNRRRAKEQSVKLSSELTSIFRGAFPVCSASRESLTLVFDIAMSAMLKVSSSDTPLEDDAFHALLHGCATKIRSILRANNECGARRTAA